MRFAGEFLALNMLLSLVVAIPSALCIDGATPPAKGAAAPQPKNQAPPRKPRLRTHEFDTKRLGEVPVIPGLEPYPGKAKLISGFYQPGAPGGTAFVAQFCTKDSKDTVLNWYRDEFKTKGWSVDASMRSDRCVAALDKSGASCQVMVNELANQDMIDPKPATSGDTSKNSGSPPAKPAKCVMVWIQYKSRS
jgi:hypothetical protein